MEEVQQRFGVFVGDDHRVQLFAKLRAFVDEAKTSGLVVSLLLNGSYVTSKSDPNDIDLVVVVSAELDLSADLLPAQYNVVSKRRVQQRFGFDIVAVREGTSEYADTVAFFEQVRGEPDRKKGLLRIML
jgi:hypothetical protein